MLPPLRTKPTSEPLSHSASRSLLLPLSSKAENVYLLTHSVLVFVVVMGSMELIAVLLQ